MVLVRNTFGVERLVSDEEWEWNVQWGLAKHYTVLKRNIEVSTPPEVQAMRENTPENTKQVKKARPRKATAIHYERTVSCVLVQDVKHGQ